MKSLANLTCSCSETIDPHSVNVIVVGILRRCKALRKSGRNARLLLRTIDLRKAYKQLPLSESALGDAYICVLNPHTGEPELYQSQVPPFGAKPSVQGFCRTSGAIWVVGLNLLRIHWSVYFDDYVAVATEEERCHLDLVLRSYFSMIGWETSDEKDGGFSSVAKALGVEVCLDEIHLGLLKVQNTEYQGSGSSLQPSSLSWRMVVRMRRSLSVFGVDSSLLSLRSSAAGPPSACVLSPGP